MTPRTTTLAAALVCALLPAGAATAQTAPEPGGTTLQSSGYGETSLRGTYGSAEVFVPLAAGRRVGGDARVDLVLDHSPLLRPRSTLTVLAGGVPVGSTRLTGDNARGGRLTAVVPSSLVGEDGVALSLRGYLRLTDDDCEEADNPGQWVTVRPASTVVLPTRSEVRVLEDVQELLTGGRAPDGVEVAVVDPGDAASLRAAGVVAAQVGRWQGEAHGDALVLPAANAARVVVGTRAPAGFPAVRDARQGVLALAQAGRVQLLVSGTDGDAVIRAARALGRPDAGLSGPVAALTGERTAPRDRSALPWRDGAATLAQLGYGRLDAVGLGAREVSAVVDRPGAWTVGRGARLDLDVEASAALRAQTSTLQVTLAGIDLGTRRLQPGAGPTTYSFDLPDGLVERRLDGRPLRSLDLVVRFLLDVPQERCQPLDPAAARASVLPTTAFRLPHGTYDGRELGRFPHPLLSRDSRRVAVVLPDSPDSPTVAAGLQVAAAVGRWSEPGDPAPDVVTASALSDEQRTGGLVLLGRADEDLGKPVDVGRTTAEPAPGQPSAVLGLVDSPFAEDLTALVVHADAEGLRLVARVLGSRAGLASLRGDHAALLGRVPASLSAAAGEQAPAALAPVVGGSWRTEVRPYTVPALVVLVGLLVVLGLVARHRWRPRR